MNKFLNTGVGNHLEKVNFKFSDAGNKQNENNSARNKSLDVNTQNSSGGSNLEII